MPFMKVYSQLSFIFLISILFGCNNAAKKPIKELIESGTENIVEHSASKLGKLAFKNIDEIEHFITSKRNFKTAFDKFSSETRKELLEEFLENPRLLENLSAPNSIVEQFLAKTADCPLARKNLNLLSFFTENKLIAKNNNAADFFNAVDLVEDLNAVKFIRKSDKLELAKLRDGVLSISDDFPFNETNLIPNTLYKLKNQKFQTDKLGRVLTINTDNISPNEITSIIKTHNEDLILSSDFDAELKKIKQRSNLSEYSVSIKNRYADDDLFSPSDLEITIKQKNTVILDRFKCGNLNKDALLSEANSFLKNYESLIGSADKQKKLLADMKSDADLAKLIKDNPEKNITRYLNSHNHVDQSKIQLVNGKIPINARTYAGNTFYFNPSLNPKLKARLDNGQLKMSKEQLLALDRLYPNGVNCSKEGLFDFSSVAYKDGNQPIMLNIGKFTGDRSIDCSKASDIFLARYNREFPANHTLHHHIDQRTMILVPTEIHDLIRHTGGHAMTKN